MNTPTRLRRFTVLHRKVRAVELSPGHFGADSVTFDDGWSMGLPANAPIRPSVGAVVDMTMDGSMRVGYSINGVVCEDPSALLYHMRNERSSAEGKLEKLIEAIRDLPQRNARVKALPPVLRDRILRFRAANLDFVWEYEQYEMACCEEAARIVAKFGTEDEILAFAKADYAKQKEMLPEMDDGHSGNTWGFAILLARLMCSAPERIQELPPAVSPITGSEAHGDWKTVTRHDMEAVA